MLDIDDDDFIDRYEAAIIFYDVAFDQIGELISHFPNLPNSYPDNLGPWKVTNPTALGCGFQFQNNDLCWVYPEGVAIRVDSFVLERGYLPPETLREARSRFLEILRRWKTNGY